jgi:hypothetical protein
MTQKTRRTAPTPIIRVEFVDVSSRAGAGVGAAGLAVFFALCVVFVRVDFFRGITVSSPSD